MTPAFSVIIPTYQRPAILLECLESLTHLEPPAGGYEVIVVNDGGVPLEAIAAPFADRLKLAVLTQANAGPAAARNRGAAAARGEFVAFTDDDCRPDSRWLVELQAKLSTHPGALVGGSVANALEESEFICSAASQCLIRYLYTYYNRDPERARFFTSNNFALARREFAAVGGFNAGYQRAAAEDRELCDRWTSLGRQMVYAPLAVVNHAHRMNLRQFWRQHFAYGRGAFQYRQSRAARDAGPVRVEPLSFYANLLLHPYRTMKRRAATATALIAMSQVANAAGFFREKRESGERRAVAPMPVKQPQVIGRNAI